MLYGWKENSMLTHCLATCAHLTITVSEIERDIGRKSSFFHTPLHSTPSLGGFHRNIATPFGMEKNRMVSLPDATHERDRQTDRQTPHADIYCAYAYASRGNKTHVTITRVYK